MRSFFSFTTPGGFYQAHHSNSQLPVLLTIWAASVMFRPRLGCSNSMSESSGMLHVSVIANLGCRRRGWRARRLLTQVAAGQAERTTALARPKAPMPRLLLPTSACASKIGLARPLPPSATIVFSSVTMMSRRLNRRFRPSSKGLERPE